MFSVIIHPTANLPAPSAPYTISVTSTSITLGWDEPVCDGGHGVASFNIEYTTGTSPFSLTEEILGIDGSQHNYTVAGLEPETAYMFRIQAISVDLAAGSFSPRKALRTLPPGTHYHVLYMYVREILTAISLRTLISRSPYINAIIFSYYSSIHCIYFM